MKNPSVPRASIAMATTYYVSSSDGNDNNTGLSSDDPWKTLAKAGQATYAAGDSLLLKCNDIWAEQFVCKGSGTGTSPVVMTSYSSGRKPRIFRLKEDGSVCIYVGGVDRWTFSNLELANAEFGIEIDSKGIAGLAGITIERCYFHDLKLNQDFYRDAQENAWWGAAIWVGAPQLRSTQPDSLTIRNCISTDCDGFYQQTEKDSGFGGFVIDGCTIKRHPANTINWMKNRMGTTRLMKNCVLLDNGGQRSMPWGGTDIIIEEGCNGTVQDCEIGRRTWYPGDGFDGCGIDFEGKTKMTNYLIKRCDIHDCSSAAVMWMGIWPNNFGDGNSVESCLFRYNGAKYTNHEIHQDCANVAGYANDNTYYLAQGVTFLHNNSSEFTAAGNIAGTLATVATPAAGKPEGSYTGTLSIALSCATDGAEIRYTLDGSFPKKTSPLYSAPITITETCALNAKAYKSGMEQSYCLSNVYVITPGPRSLD